MDERTQRRLLRETVKEIDYAKFIKEHTHNKNITARENRMLRRRVLKDEYMKKEELNKKYKIKEKKEKQENVFVSIPISDLRKILQAKKYANFSLMRGNLAEFNYHMLNIGKICEKHIK